MPRKPSPLTPLRKFCDPLALAQTIATKTDWGKQCNHTLTHTRAYLGEHLTPSQVDQAVEVLATLEAVCDCTVVFNVGRLV